MKIRIPAGNKLYEDSWAAYGTLPVALAMDEVYTGLEQGVIDGCEMPIDTLYYSGLHEAAKYLALTNHMMYLQYIMINADIWNNQLTEEERTIFNETAAEIEEYHNELMKKMIDEIVEDMKSKGVTVTEINMKDFIDATIPVLEKWMDDWGRDVYDAFRPN